MEFSRRYILKAFGSASLVPALISCGGSDSAEQPKLRVNFEGLSGRVVLRLRPLGGGLVAATDDGLFQRSSGAWVSRGLSGMSVLDIASVADAGASGGQRWIASVRNAAGVSGLAESTNAGQSWATIDSNFGGGMPDAVHALQNDPARGRLLATGTDVLAASVDNGRTWIPLGGNWGAFAQPSRALAIDPRTADIWYGGQNAIEELSLYVLKSGTTAPQQFTNLMPAPSVADAVRFSSTQPARVLVSGEGGIVETFDGGRSWQRLLADGYNFYFDVLQDPLNPQRWVTARWLKELSRPQRLHLRISENDGRTWDIFEVGDASLFGGTRSMASAIEGGRSVFYLGLFKGGVARVEFL